MESVARFFLALLSATICSLLQAQSFSLCDRWKWYLRTSQLFLLHLSYQHASLSAEELLRASASGEPLSACLNLCARHQFVQSTMTQIRQGPIGLCEIYIQRNKFSFLSLADFVVIKCAISNGSSGQGTRHLHQGPANCRLQRLVRLQEPWDLCLVQPCCPVSVRASYILVSLSQCSMVCPSLSIGTPFGCKTTLSSSSLFVGLWVVRIELCRQTPPSIHPEASVAILDNYQRFTADVTQRNQDYPHCPCAAWLETEQPSDQLTSDRVALSLRPV